jgi:lactate permease
LIGLQGVTGLDLKELSAMVGRQLPFFSLIVPFWLVWAFAGFRGMLEIWPAILVAGFFFAVPQFLMSNFHGPWLVDVVAALVSIAAVAIFLKFWQPKRIWRFPGEVPENDGAELAANLSANQDKSGAASQSEIRNSQSAILRAWLPWIILSVVVFIWGLPQTKAFIDGLTLLLPVPV